MNLFGEEGVSESHSVVSDSQSMEFSRPEWVAFPLVQGIFPSQGSNLGLPHCRRIFFAS